MPIQIRVLESEGEADLLCPVYVCDHCGKQITGAGLYLYRMDSKRVRLVHKGTCDREFTRERKGHWLSRELSELAQFLQDNFENEAIEKNGDEQLDEAIW